MKKWVIMCMCAFLLCGCGTKTSSQDAQPAQTQPTQAGQTKQEASPQADSKGTSNSSGTQSDTTVSQKISEQEALEVALSHAGVKESDLTSKRIKREWEDGVEVYDIEFHTNGKEYDYEIQASDGSILESDYEVEND